MAYELVTCFCQPTHDPLVCGASAITSLACRSQLPGNPVCRSPVCRKSTSGVVMPSCAHGGGHRAIQRRADKGGPERQLGAVIHQYAGENRLIQYRQQLIDRSAGHDSQHGNVEIPNEPDGDTEERTDSWRRARASRPSVITVDGSAHCRSSITNITGANEQRSSTRARSLSAAVETRST